MKFLKWIEVCSVLVVLVACGGGGGSAGNTGSIVTPPPSLIDSATTSVTALAISAPTNPVNANNSDAATIIVTALNASNALVAGAEIKIAADSGVLSASSGTTNANGQVSFNFASGILNQSNRVALITATAGAKSAQTSIRIAGGSLSIDGNVNTVSAGSAPFALIATLRDASGATIPNVTLTLSSSNPTIVAGSNTSALSNSSGVATFLISGLSPGFSTMSISGNGIIATRRIDVTSAGASFFFTSPSAATVISTGVSQTLTVQAGTATQVQFVTSLGRFTNGTNAQLVPVSGGVANAFLTMPSSGQATINAINSATPSISATLGITASPPVSSANKILLTASRNSVPVSVGSTLNTIQVKARAIFNNNGIDAGVFNVPMLFTISGGPGAGEYLSSAIVYTNSAGEAVTDLVAGSQATTQNGITVAAQILGTSVSTGLLPSSNNLALTIGGQALSVAFSPATEISSSADNTYYELAFSALVADAGGGAVPNVPVSLNVKPYAFSVGTNACAPSATTTFTYCSEDRNGNGSLDAGEDGVRVQLPFGLSPVSCTNPIVFGTSNSQLTPPNSAAGTVPSTVITNGVGVASFSLTYLKSSAVWVVVELSASVSSNGTEAKSSSIFRLAPSAPDASAVPCPLPPSPYSY